MSEFHTSSFRGATVGLFNPGQITGLMRAEYERANRYGFPVLFMVVAVDRLVELQHLYGYESREAIMDSTIEIVTQVTRASDFLGCMDEDRILVLLTHTQPEIGGNLASRILAGARKLEFHSDGRRLRVSLSVGLSHNQHRGARTFEGMVDVAQEALKSAISTGGDRYVEREEVEEELRGLEEQLAQRSLLMQSEHESLIQETAAEVPRKARAMEVQIEEVFNGVSMSSDEMERLREEMLGIARREAEKERDQLIAERVADRQREIDRLERRVSKLTENLGMTEEELRRIAKMKNIELGLSSIYRTVQGLSGEDGQVEKKKELMKDLFEQNVAIQDSFTSGG